MYENNNTYLYLFPVLYGDLLAMYFQGYKMFNLKIHVVEALQTMNHETHRHFHPQK